MIDAAEVSFVSASYNSSSARSRAARRPSLVTRSRARDVVARARVDLEAIARVDEQRDLDDETGLQRRRLAGTRDTIALDPRLGLAHDELDRGRQLDAHDLGVVH